MYKIIALMGPAGCGKDTLLRALLNSYPAKYNEIISCTTRPPREGEIDGVNYYFISEAEFNFKVSAGEMLEISTFNSWRYGSPVSGLSNEKINVGVFNPEGIWSLKNNSQIDVKVYYLRASDKIRLLRQLNREENPNVTEIIRRFSADKANFSQAALLPTYIPIDCENLDDLFKAAGLIASDNFD